MCQCPGCQQPAQLGACLRQATKLPAMYSSRPGTHLSLKNRFSGFLLPQKLVICLHLEKNPCPHSCPISQSSGTMETLSKWGITHRDRWSRKHGPTWLRAPFPPPCKPWAIHEHLAWPCTLASAGRLTETEMETEIAPGGNSPREGAIGAQPQILLPTHRA